MVVASSKVRIRGQVTLPKPIQKGLRVKAGEELTWVQIADGVVMLSKTLARREQIAEQLLNTLVTDLGRAAASQDIHAEEDLDLRIKTLRKRSFEARHG